MIKNFYAKLLSSKASPLLIFVCGILVQIITYLPLLYWGIDKLSYERMELIFSILSFLWFFIPLVSIGAIIISIIQILRKKASALTVIGLILNIIWLILFSCISLLLFSGRLSV